ncbi:tetratricopeptide repeat protein [Sphingomonas sp. Mn802worker]|uniref:tetratricopeptide repeat protein n=1 Tax=Sphingomonas sp. Mn802worker TaxID=629773 RepID=UPI0003726C83|nr:tetratricopeptide repeat protein [Sphingomonas sp. Mn802worker]
MRTGLLLLVATLSATPALAKDRTGYTAIAAGNLAQAETTLDAERAIFPRRPEVLLNLAAVYARTTRTARARALYDDVLRSAPVSLNLADGGTTSSHEVAERGLARLGTAIAAR